MNHAALSLFASACALGLSAILFDRRGRMLDVAMNGKSVFGPEIAGLRWLEFIHPDDAAHVFAFVMHPDDCQIAFRYYSPSLKTWCHSSMVKLILGNKQFCTIEVTPFDDSYSFPNLHTL